MTRLKQQLLRYWLAMNFAGLQGGALAVKAFLGLAGLSVAGAPVKPLDLQQAGYIFFTGFIYHLCAYIQANPLPIVLVAPAAKEVGA